MMIWDKYCKEMEHIYADDAFQRKLMDRLHSQQHKHENKLRFTLRYAMTCMLLCICVLSTILVLYQPTSNVEKKITKEKVAANLPKISVDLNQVGSMGGMVSIESLNPKEDFKTGNPITANTKITTLPVYRNGIITDVTGGQILEGGLSDEQLNRIFEQYKTIFQFQELQKDISYTMSIQRVYDEGRLEVARDGTISINLNTSSDFAKQFDEQITTRKQAEKMALKFANTYKSQLNLKSPISDVSVSYRSKPNDYGELEIIEKKYMYSIYEKGSSLQEQIDSYNFRKIDFLLSEDGSLSSNQPAGTYNMSIQLHNDIRGELVGKYPVITRKEAKEQFRKGKYFSNSPDPKEDGEIVYMDLIYQYTKVSEYIVPFYRIYAPAKDDLHYPLKEGEFYGIYYVPAIPERYIKTED